jgi:hypothetical protein
MKGGFHSGRKLPVSLMPAGYDRTLTPEELADLVAFLLCQTRPAGQVAKAP